MMDLTRPTCVHCGVVLLFPGAAWCAMCQRDARENRGMCAYCHKDITEWGDCWSIRRALDQTLVKKHIPFMGGCPSCREHGAGDVEMEVVELTVSQRTKYLRMVCPKCGSRCETRYSLQDPPPKATLGKPPWDPNG